MRSTKKSSGVSKVSITLFVIISMFFLVQAFSVLGLGASKSIAACVMINGSVNVTGTLTPSGLGSCISVNASNIDINCKGNLINYSLHSTNTSLFSAINITGNFTNITVRNCRIIQHNLSASPAIVINGTEGQVQVVNTSIRLRGDAPFIRVGFAGGVNISNNTFGIGVANSTNGIFVYNSTNVTITDNTISATNNTVSIVGSTNVNVSNNFLNITSGSTMGLAAAVFINRSNGTYVAYNQINTTGAKARGIAVGAASIRFNISFNNITANGAEAFGIYINHSANSSTADNANVTYNQIHMFGADAIGLHVDLGAKGGLWFWRNNVTTDGARGQGIVLNRSKGNKFEYNNVTTNASNAQAIVLSNSSNNNLTGNYVITYGNQSHGITLDNASGNRFVSNNVTVEMIIASGLLINQTSGNNSFINFNITKTSNQTNKGAMTIYRVVKDIGFVNQLIFDNEFGSINWSSSNLTTNLTNFSIGKSIYLQENLIGMINNSLEVLVLNNSGDGNTTISFKGLTYTQDVKLLKDHARCDTAANCSNMSYAQNAAPNVANGVVTANISSFSMYHTEGVTVAVKKETFSGNGGGGSGGRSSARRKQVEVSSEPTVMAMFKQDTVEFDLGTNHYVMRIVQTVPGRNAKVRVGPKIVDIAQGESVTVDLDRDGTDDVKVTLNSVVYNKADVTMTLLTGKEEASALTTAQLPVMEEVRVESVEAPKPTSKPAMEAPEVSGNAVTETDMGSEGGWGTMLFSLLLIGGVLVLVFKPELRANLKDKIAGHFFRRP